MVNFTRGALTVLMNGGGGMCQALGCHHPSTLTLPRHPHVLYTLKVWSLQVTAISAFLVLPIPWAIGHGSWVHGKCFATPGTTLGHVGLWGGLSEASPCQLRGSLGPYCYTRTHQEKEDMDPSAPDSLDFSVACVKVPSPPRTQSKEPG